MATKHEKLQQQMQKLIDHVKKKGALHTPDEVYEYHLQTRAGLLRLAFSCSDRLISVFAKFDEPAAAIALLPDAGIWRCSGKCNTHMLDDTALKSELAEFIEVIDTLMEGL